MPTRSVGILSLRSCNGVFYQWHEFNAQHAFLRDEGPRYDPAWHCYGLVMELFHRKLGQGDLAG